MKTATFAPRSIATSRRNPSSLIARIGVWMERHRSRQALAALSAERLADIGITAEDARAEASKPFWIG